MGRDVLTRYGTFEELLHRANHEIGGDDLITYRQFSKTGTLSADTVSDVWITGGAMTRLTIARTLSIVSASANDTVGGTGARYVLVHGLDSNYNYINETIALNGTTPVVTTQTFLRVHKAIVAVSGSGATNAGAITFTATTDNAVQVTIGAGRSISQKSHFTIPAGYTGYLLEQVFSVYRASGSGTKDAEIEYNAYSPTANTIYKSLTYGISNAGSGLVVTDPHVLPHIPEKTDIWYTATASAAATVVTVSVGYLLVKGNGDITALI